MTRGYVTCVSALLLIAAVRSPAQQTAAPTSAPPPVNPPAVVPAPPATLPAGVKTGEFHLTLTTRSHNTAPRELAKRFGMKREECTGDYDLAKFPLAVYVPTAYDPNNPPGLVVFTHPGRFETVADSIRPLMDEMHLIFVAPVEDPPAGWQEAGLALDIVDAIRSTYTVDKSRIYLMAADDVHFMTFATADIFTGFISVFKFSYPGTIGGTALRKGLAPSPRIDPQDLHVPPATLMDAAKTRPFFFASVARMGLSREDMNKPVIVTHMFNHGFKHVSFMEIEVRKLFYPHIYYEFLRPAFMFLDNLNHPGMKYSRPGQTPNVAGKSPEAPAAPNPPPAGVKPATAIDADAHAQAERLLDFGRIYIETKDYPSARSKLNELIEKYPNDPDAATARQLLTGLPH